MSTNNNNNGLTVTNPNADPNTPFQLQLHHNGPSSPHSSLATPLSNAMSPTAQQGAGGNLAPLTPQFQRSQPRSNQQYQSQQQTDTLFMNDQDSFNLNKSNDPIIQGASGPGSVGGARKPQRLTQHYNSLPRNAAQYVQNYQQQGIPNSPSHNPRTLQPSSQQLQAQNSQHLFMNAGSLSSHVPQSPPPSKSGQYAMIQPKATPQSSQQSQLQQQQLHQQLSLQQQQQHSHQQVHSSGYSRSPTQSANPQIGNLSSPADSEFSSNPTSATGSAQSTGQPNVAKNGPKRSWALKTINFTKLKESNDGTFLLDGQGHSEDAAAGAYMTTNGSDDDGYCLQE